MASYNFYLNFPGTTSEAFDFYKSVFGGEFSDVNRYGEIPDMDIPEEHKDKIMHITLPLDGGAVLMGADAMEFMGHQHVAGNNVNISIQTDSKEEADRLFNGLSAGGTVKMPLQDTFWNAYFGMLEDKYGIHWMVNHDYGQG